jgi:hypothetical protein
LTSEAGSVRLAEKHDAGPLLRIEARLVEGTGLLSPPCAVQQGVASFSARAAKATFVTLLGTLADLRETPPRLRDGKLTWEGRRGRLTITLPIGPEKSYDWAPGGGIP